MECLHPGAAAHKNDLEYAAMVIGRWRWPDGFVCPKCNGHEHCILTYRDLYQCHAWCRQTSLTAGTIFASTKVPLTT